jgi:hypothetical protein
MPGIFSYAAAADPAGVTGGTAGLAADRGHEALLPSAQAPAHTLLPAGGVGPVASRGESQAVGRIFS